MEDYFGDDYFAADYFGGGYFGPGTIVVPPTNLVPGSGSASGSRRLPLKDTPYEDDDLLALIMLLES